MSNIVKKIKQLQAATNSVAVMAESVVIQLLLTCSKRPMCLIHLSAINASPKESAVTIAPAVNSGRPQRDAPTFEMYARCCALHISG